MVDEGFRLRKPSLSGRNRRWQYLMQVAVMLSHSALKNLSGLSPRPGWHELSVLMEPD